ncbi:DUF6415 family natural product biosynthesis protein [Streptomyces sp. AN091965]|uniref:DUF6415 family natural product biosynthesis protein n=1 Tax=Streptomyces sp. AN091965 TaxID=2927803 RepID=UPI001F614A35|nr:DUF6415 family natural product biosynthesis protein [Streptomyces sp. AN091965]MCI3929174.1 DUF6415 family natural product biosynthesis protein [Streptomyces sp. AN091965]
MTPTVAQLDLAGLVEASMAALGELPAAQATAPLHRRLVTEIRLRLPRAERAAAAAPERSREWYAHLRVIDAAHDALLMNGEEPGPSDSPLIAALNLAELGRRLRDLMAYSAEGEGS